MRESKNCSNLKCQKLRENIGDGWNENEQIQQTKTSTNWKPL